MLICTEYAEYWCLKADSIYIEWDKDNEERAQRQLTDKKRP